MYEYLPTYMYVHHMCAWAPRRPDEGVRSPGTGVTGGYEPLHGWWKINPCPLKVHKVLGRHPSNSPIYVFIRTTVRNKLLRKIMYFLKAEAVFKIKPLAIYAGSNGCEPPRKLIWGWRCTEWGLAGSVWEVRSSPFHMPHLENRAAPSPSPGIEDTVRIWDCLWKWLGWAWREQISIQRMYRPHTRHR